jgi:hypothetical protein
LPLNSKLGSFRLLPKLHKEKFSCRPIVNCKNHPTERICQVIDLILQPLVKSTESYIKDSQDVLIKTKDIITNNDATLYSFDFESLYTNIDTTKLLVLVTEFVTPYLSSSKHINASGFYYLLKLVLENNIFKFDIYYYIQIFGIIMGAICGPTLANTYVWILEKHWLKIQRPIFYGRFIDDIFMVNDKFNLVEFEAIFDGLKLNFIKGDMVIFLDLEISINHILNRLCFKLFIKPTNTFSYLLNTSNHPSHIFKNIPKSLFIRIRRICTYYHDYLLYSRNLVLQLVKRGYNYQNVNKIACQIGSVDRSNFLNYKYKTNIYDNRKIIISSLYDQSIQNYKNVMKITWNNDFVPNHVIYQPNELLIVPNIQMNLKALLIFNRKPVLKYRFCTNPCNSAICSTCKFVCNLRYLTISENFFIPMLSYSNCLSENVIYIIICKKCNYFYIGQSGTTIKNRINQHLNNIKRYINFNISHSEVADHFDKNHNVNKDFRYVVFNSNVIEKSKRLNIEADLIHIFLNMGANVINGYIPNKYNMKTLAFS